MDIINYAKIKALKSIAQLKKLTQDDGTEFNVGNVDLNSLTQMFCYVGSGSTNLPMNGRVFHVITIPQSDTTKLQLAYIADRNIPSNAYFRIFGLGSWSPWGKLFSNLNGWDIPYARGDFNGSTPLPQNSWITIVPSLNVEAINGVTLVNGIFTIPSAGIYNIFGHANVDSLASGADFYLVVYINGSLDTYSRLCFKHAYATQKEWLEGSTILKCSAGDTIEIKVYQTSATIPNLIGGSVRIAKIGL